MKKKISIAYIFFLLPLIFFFFINYSRQVDDIWFLFSHGRYILNNGIPHKEFLTIHSGLHFVMQQWAFSTILYFLYHYLGSYGVLFLVGTINILIIYFLYKLCMTISSGNKYFSCLLTSIIDLLLELCFIIPRPQIISYLILIITLYILERFTKNKDDKIIYLLPILSILLVNFHASMWFMLFIFCLPFIAEYLLYKDKRIFKLIIIMLISFIVGFLNPYGSEAMFYSLSSYGVKTINILIREMHSFSLKGDSFLITYSSLILLIIIIEFIFFIKNHRNYSIHSICFFLGLSFMAFLNLRNISLLIIGTMPYIIYSFKRQIKKEVPVYSIIILVLIVLIIPFIKGKDIYTIEDPTRAKIVNYLNKNTFKDKVILFTYFNDGPYLEYNGYKVYMDTRAEIFLKKNNKKEDIFDEYYKVLIGKIDYEKFTKKYHFTHLLVNKNTKIDDYLKHNKNYRKVYTYKNIYLYERI